MPRPGDRRPLLADHAITVLARGGARSLTHQAVDRDARLAAGSTSYYFRTREALVAAAVERMRHHSRAAFDAMELPARLTAKTAARFIAEQLHALATVRREQALAIVALLPESSADAPALMDCLFSRELARNLTRALGCESAPRAADDLVDLLTGRLISILFRDDCGSEDDRSATQQSVERLLLSSTE